MNAISPLAKTIPESVFMLYQMTFAVITVALVAGSVADRMRFSAFLWFVAGWLLLVYVPIAHWVWGGGFLGTAGVLDFAGGTVVHLNAGIAGLVACYLLGLAARLRHRQSRAVRSVARGDRHRPAVGRLVRLQRRLGARRQFARRLRHRRDASRGVRRRADLDGAGVVDRGKPSVLGMISGAVAGLGTITPASGFVLPWHGIVIGIVAGAVCYWACTKLKTKCRYDDSLDVFGVHGIGGATGTILAGVFAVAAVGDTAGLLEGNSRQVLIQLYGVVVTLAWSGVVTFVLLKVIGFFLPLRVREEDERIGLDVVAARRIAAIAGMLAAGPPGGPELCSYI